jgi:hypothetical protein
MTPRRRPRPIWLAVLLVMAGVGLAGGTAARPTDEGGAAHGPSPVTLIPIAVDVAVVPARTEAGARSVHQSPGRSPVPLVAALVAVVGLLGVADRRSDPPPAGRPPVRARRHTIALRAPPAPRFV